MDRLARLAAHPKRTLASLALLLAAGALTIGSGASFSASTANPTNQFTTGSLSMSNSKNNQAILTASLLKPGDVTTGTVDIGNTGTIPGTFTLRRSALTNSDTTNPLSTRLQLVVKDCGAFSGGTAPTCDAGDTKVYDGTLTAMTNTVALGSYAAGAEHRYEFTTTFDAQAGNEYQGDSSVTTFTWDATE